MIVAVGRSRDPLTDPLVEDYVRRCPWPIRLVEVQPRGQLAPERRRAAEALLLRRAVPPGTVAVALDEHGQDPSSVELAARLGRWRDEGRAGAAFLIGGPDGHDPELLATCAWRLALGRLTWPHRLVRPMLAEQLYRATTILSGHPYHRA
ncbi:MAG: 23S rRNA (pseudouridine(1915)-N(3))-methyltransferase RlmH [Geminicoccaceae bacterium]